MKLSSSQFTQLLQENHLRVSVVGMSNIGKTYWSKKLSEIGFCYINCDDLIEAKLAPVLKARGYAGIAGVARWMGQPYEDRFLAHQQKYLAMEEETMENIFAEIKNGRKQNTVIDTTGSIVHTRRHIMTQLAQCSLVIYIEATADRKEKNFHQYITDPKPVIFGEWFTAKENETKMQTLERCYRTLLNVRSARYAEYADVIIPRGALENKSEGHQFIALIAQSL